MSKSDGRGPFPRAVIHKNILDTARDQPEASMEEIADEVSGATIQLVSRVLNKYGDPKTEDHKQENTDETMVTEQSQFNVETLSNKQIETLRAIYENPDASQRELAEILGSSQPSLNERVNSIEGFDWSDREEFVTRLFEASSLNGNGKTAASAETEETETKKKTEMETISPERVGDLEERVDALEAEQQTVFRDPDLAHRVVHACIDSDKIDEAEELVILKEFIEMGDATIER